MSFVNDLENKKIKLENADCLTDVNILSELASKIYAGAVSNAENLGGLSTEEVAKQLDITAKASFFFADRFITQQRKHLTYMRK